MNKTLTTVLILIVVILGGYFLLKNPKVQTPSEEISETSSTDIQAENISGLVTPPIPVINNSLANQEVITYTDTGYSPSTIYTKVGSTVTWENNSSLPMWTASGIHPSHIIYSGTSLEDHCPDVAGIAFDACKEIAPGNSWSFTFNKKGTWKYHNHSKASHWGTVVVE